VAQVRNEDVSPEAIGKQIVAALHIAQAELEAGALLTIEIDRTRLRLLPLQ
jgi:predicted nuclease of predicted toxin-antitoxin system